MGGLVDASVWACQLCGSVVGRWKASERASATSPRRESMRGIAAAAAAAAELDSADRQSDVMVTTRARAPRRLGDAA